MDDLQRLDALLRELSTLTPKPPDAITWERGVEILNLVQDKLCPLVDALPSLKSGGGTFALEDGMIVWKPNGAALIRAALVSAHDTMLAIRTTDLGRSDREMLDAARAQVRTALEEFKPSGGVDDGLTCSGVNGNDWAEPHPTGGETK